MVFLQRSLCWLAIAAPLLQQLHFGSVVVVGYTTSFPWSRQCFVSLQTTTPTALGPIRSESFVENVLDEEDGSIVGVGSSNQVEEETADEQPQPQQVPSASGEVEAADAGFAEEEEKALEDQQSPSIEEAPQSAEIGVADVSEEPDAVTTVEDEVVDDGHDDHHDDDIEVEIWEVFQELMQTRRTSGKFVPIKELPPEYESEKEFWIQVLDRAVECAVQAPNHKMTEPFSFKRMISPSNATERLAEIAFQVNLRKQVKATTATERKDMEGHSPGAENEQRMKSAREKRAKWASIPAFLVVTVAQENMCVDIDKANNDYDSLPFVPIQTERALEDYASACAAVQNVLLSLHSENIASKWATGPVIETPAFRKLLQLEPEDRVVALIMIGDHPNTNLEPRVRINRRSIQGDVLLDL